MVFRLSQNQLDLKYLLLGKRCLPVRIALPLSGLLALLACNGILASVGIAQTLPLPALQAYPSATSSPPSESYTLGAGDRLRIDILRVPQYSGDNEVLVDGSLNLPVVGSVLVKGLTLEQASRAIADAYSNILRRPLITVTLLAPRSINIGIAGEVNRPGTYVIALQSSQIPTLTQVLETAGGIRQSADLRQVQIRRPHPSGIEQTIDVDLWQLLQTGNLRYDPSLRDGDTIFIPAASEINPVESSQIAAASFSGDEERPINIAVVGEVFRPGPYTVTGSARTGAAGVPGGASGAGRLPTVTRAIQVAGGIKPLANVRQVQIRRPTRDGIEQVVDVDLWQLLDGGDLNQDVILQEGDTIFVPTAPDIPLEEAAAIASSSFAPDTIRINVVGEVRSPGTVSVPPNTPLNQALLAAGGFSNRAQRRSVQLIRLNPNGTVSQRGVPVDFANNINDQTNPVLNNNDVIVVGRSGLASVADTLDTALSPLTRFVTLFGLPFRFFGLFD